MSSILLKKYTREIKLAAEMEAEECREGHQLK